MQPRQILKRLSLLCFGFQSSLFLLSKPLSWWNYTFLIFISVRYNSKWQPNRFSHELKNCWVCEMLEKVPFLSVSSLSHKANLCFGKFSLFLTNSPFWHDFSYFSFSLWVNSIWQSNMFSLELKNYCCFLLLAAIVD